MFLSRVKPHGEEELIEISGYQTLLEVADVYKIAAEYNIPGHLIHEKLGRLRKSYPFTMDDIRESIINNDSRIKR